VFGEVKLSLYQAWTGTGVSRKLRLTDSRKSVHEGGKPYKPAAFTPQEIFVVFISVRA
jgi:hypothetical protein